MIHPNDIVFDVGASTGDKTAVYLRQGARVVCFEPEPGSFAKLCGRYKDNPNVRLVPMGVGASAGRATLHVCSKTPTISTFSEQWMTGRFAKYQWTGESVVDMVTLDRAIAHYGVPQFIKIDVEGYELQALRGLSQRVPYLSFEFADEFHAATWECLSRLTQLGYQDFNVCFGTEPEFACEWTTADKVMELVLKQPQGCWGDIYCRDTETNQESKP